MTNARRMVDLFEQMRERRPGPAFATLKQLGLSFSHLQAMRLLAHGGLLAMKELAEQLQMTPPSVTALTRRLVHAGLVQRTTHAEDSRVVLLSLTDTGREFHERLSQEHIERIASLLKGLSEQEQRQFLDLLERAVAAMRSRPEGAETPDREDA